MAPYIADLIEPAGDNNHDVDEFAVVEVEAASATSKDATADAHQKPISTPRRYHQYRHGRYPIPNDDAEQNRDNMKHVMFLELTNGKTFYAPLKKPPKRVLDLGTGTGTWAVDVARAYPDAEVIGIDLSPIQSTQGLPNLSFQVGDIENTWLNGEDFDLVHLRLVIPWMKNIGDLLQRAYDNLEPEGWIELQEFDGIIASDDNTIPQDSAVLKLFDLAEAAVKKYNMTWRAAGNLQKPLENAGFTNVSKVVLKVPIGVWAKEPRMRLIGKYLRTVMNDMFNAMAAKPLLALNLQPAEIDALLASARQEMDNPDVHEYEAFYFWIGQKPRLAR